jgi:hypothetical protein
VRVFASHLRFDELPAQVLFGILDTAPDVAVAFPQVAGGLLDGSGFVHGAQHFAQAEAKRVTAVDLQPNLDPRDQVDSAANARAWHGTILQKRCARTFGRPGMGIVKAIARRFL